VSDERAPYGDRNRLERWEIRVEGHVDGRGTDWLDGMSLTPQEDGTTLLTGPLADQAALHGMLKRLRDVGAQIVSVTRIAPRRAGGGRQGGGTT
jgi:hypothetical protein